jgi:lysophospholipase L1-like esterase
MPPLLAAALVGLEVGGITIGATAASAIAYGVTTIAAIGARFAFNRLTEKKGQRGDPQITSFTIRQPLPQRVRAYGTVKISGALFFEDAIPIQFQPLLLGVVFCEGPCSQFRSYYLNDANVGMTSGNISCVNLALPWATNVSIEGRLGTDNQTVNGLLAGQRGWSEQRLLGLCYGVMLCAQPIRPDKYFQFYYPNGVPTLRAVIDSSLVFDPRDNSQNWANQGTWKFSRNPALIIMDYLTITRRDATGRDIPRGMGLPKSRINIASFTKFANICDEPMGSDFTINAIDGSVSQTARTEPRYSCDGAYSMDDDPPDVLNRILATCDGTLLTLADGTIGIRGGKWDPPTVVITDEMIIRCDLTQGNGKLEKFNQLKINSTASNLDYQLVEGSPWEDLDDQDENGVLSEELSLPYVTSYSQARRLAKIAMAKGNPEWRYNSLVCTFEVLNALGEEFVHVKHSIMGIDDDFLVTGFKIQLEDRTVELQLSSIDSGAYSWNASQEDEAPPSATGIISSAGDPIGGSPGGNVGGSQGGNVGNVPAPVIAPSNTVAPAISGSATTGSVLTCNTGTWSGDPTITYAYQWKWANTNTNISGATNSTYTIVPDDIGHTIKCDVTASNTAGSASASSNTTAVIVGASGPTAMPSGAIGIWYVDQYSASPSGIQNAAGSTPLTSAGTFDGNMYLSGGTAPSGGMLDFNSGEHGIVALASSVLFTQGTVIYSCHKESNGTGEHYIIADSGNYHFWSAGENPGFQNSSTFMPGQQSGDLWDRLGAGWHISSHAYDTSSAECWIDGVKVLSKAASPNSHTIGGFDIGVVNGTVQAGYKINALAVYNRKLSATEQTAAYNALKARALISGIVIPATSPEKILFAMGDSITDGSYGTFADPGYVYVAARNASPAIRGGNLGIGGKTVATTDTDFDATYGPMISAAVATSGRDIICSLALGTNDLGIYPGGVSAWLTAFAALCDKVRATGAKLIVGTLQANIDSTFNSRRATANATIRTWVGTHADAIMDFGSDSIMGADATASNGTYFQDGTHPTGAGHALLAPYLVTAINSL